MARCKCGEHRAPDPRWRRKKGKPKGRGFQWLIVCLSCEWEWWSSAKSAPTWPLITLEEREQLGLHE